MSAQLLPGNRTSKRCQPRSLYKHNSSILFPSSLLLNSFSFLDKVHAMEIPEAAEIHHLLSSYLCYMYS